MGAVKTIGRRGFLIGSAAVMGGVAFGTFIAAKPTQNPLLADLGEGEAAFNPYVKITADGITLITPRADSGQGAYSMQAYLIAEELDIDPASAMLSPGMPGAAYYNAAVLGESVPVPAYIETPMVETARAFMSVPAKLFEMQMTGGSSTVPDQFVKLRLAGAVARETLKEAAAQRFGVARSSLATRDGLVVSADGEEIDYISLAAEAAQLEPVAVREEDLRPASEWRFLGKQHARTDMVAKSTGTEIYGIDLQMDGMRYAAICANPSIGGPLVEYDASSAEAMRGVEKIVEVKAGNAGVAVIATNTWYAFQAVQAIECVWGSADYPSNSGEMWDALAEAVDSEAHFDHCQRDVGEVAKSLAAAHPFEAEYRAPFLAHAPMEPMNAIVKVDGERVDIWTGTQIPLFIRNRAAQIAGVDTENVHVHVQPMGGSFGHRLEMTHVEQAVEVAQAMPGTPIKLTWSREEDMSHDYPRPAALMRARGVVTDGKVETYDISVSQQGLAGPWLGRLTGMTLGGPDATITTGSWDQPFAIPNYRVTGYRARDLVPVSSWRSVGASANGFFHDTFLDELIHEAGADPLEERIRLCLHDESRKVLEAVGEISGWDGGSIGPGRGRGVAFCMSFGVPCAEVVEVSQTDAGLRLDKAYVVADVGRALDPVNLEAQLFGGLIFGLAHAINSELTYEDFRPAQDNYHAYEGLRLYQTPQIEVKVLENGRRIRGIGEPGLPPAAPALGNAIFAATGTRLREMPFNKFVDFV
ncbi:MAG: molybdopterin cofactor-binding domain-containing protein [Pseudomonadota bacterium]